MPVAEDGSIVPASFYPSRPTSRNVSSVARQLSDKTTARIAASAGTRDIIATISSVSAGAASDGNAKVVLLWRGGLVTACGYLASYTPVTGHRVVCHLIDNQLIVAGRIIGQP